MAEEMEIHDISSNKIPIINLQRDTQNEPISVNNEADIVDENDDVIQNINGISEKEIEPESITSKTIINAKQNEELETIINEKLPNSPNANEKLGIYCII